jgi:hypothetical protein
MQTDKKREIAGCERAVWKRGIISLNLVCAAHLDPGCLQGDDLPQALEILRKRHPLLGVHLEQDRGRGGEFLVADQTENIPIRVIYGAREGQWRKELAEELQTPFDTGKHSPLARLLLIHSPNETTLVMTVHHCTCDGMSLVFALRDLLSCIGGDADRVLSGLPDEYRFPRCVPLPPLSAPLRVGIAVINSLSGYLPRPVQADRISMERNRVLCWHLDRKTTAALLGACSRNRVTVHAALSTLFLAAQLEVQGSDSPIHRRVYSPASIRGLLQPDPGEEFGLYATDSSLSFSYRPSLSFWHNVRNLQVLLRRSTIPGKLLRLSALVDKLSPRLIDRIVVSAYRKKKLRFGFCLSNLGLMAIPTSYNGIRLKGISPPVFYVQRAEKTVSILTMDKRMYFSFIHRPGRLAENIADAVRDRAMKLLCEQV